MANADLTAINHIGVRIKELGRSVEFYARLGFDQIWYSERHSVAGLRNAAGIELNLIVNGKNILMDATSKYPGYTHISFRVPSIEDTVRMLNEKTIQITEGPINLGGEIAVFVRDPDGNVIELAEIVPVSGPEAV